MKKPFFALVALAAFFLLALPPLGCSSSPSTSGDEANVESEEAKEIAANLAKLSPADRALAEKQKICPVGEAPLGSMGMPIKVALDDRDVFICCAGCEEVLRESPEEYLANLPE